MLVRLPTTALLLSLLAVHFAVGKQSEQFRDFSHKGSEYSALGNLRFAADDIQYSGSETIDILGNSHSALKFLLTVTVTVETADAVGPVNTSVYEKRRAVFEVFVVEDKERTIHDTFVRDTYAAWKKTELYSGEYFFDFQIRNNGYVLTAIPDLVNVKSFYFIWVNGRAVKVLFKGFEDKSNGGAGVMDSFTSDCLRISVGDADFVAYREPLHPQKQFVALYEKGFFNSPHSHN
jgi:hypothetical protein